MNRLVQVAKKTEGMNVSDSTAGIDMRRMRAHRLGRLRQQLAKYGYDACVLFNPNNIRYATGSRNMQVCALHCPTRYVFVPASGPVTLFDYFGTEHLSEDLETIDEVRPAVVWDFFSAGDRVDERVARFSADIIALMRSRCGAGGRLALDAFDPKVCRALERGGLTLFHAQEPLEMARVIKSPDEIKCMSMGISVCETGLWRMQQALEPGLSENELWSILHQTNIAMGGEWIETRLLSSGGRTNPWFQESSDRVIRAGDLVCIDTDLIGPFGYGVDMSRTWLCGQDKPSDEQRTLYKLAHENIEHNISVLRAGMPFSELVEKSWRVPEEYQALRYSKIVHGVGLGFEYPYIPYREDWADYGYEGIIEENMTLCIESYIGRKGGAEGVKLEQQVLITGNGAQALTTYPFEREFLI
jgi:Xaa-Pro aminopeptidase